MATQYTAGITNGQVWSADIANTIGAVSETYTPTWTATVTNPVLGNGTLSGRYFRIQKLVFVDIYLLTGSTTTYGSGSWRFSLPVAARTGLSGYQSWGIARAFDASIGVSYFAQVLPDNITSAASVYTPSAFYGSTVPFTWATNDTVSFSFWYEAA